MQRSTSDTTPEAQEPQSTAPSILVIGDLCLDENEIEGRALEPSWGSPALFIARHLREAHGLDALVSGAYGPDLLPYLHGFTLDRGPVGQRSLCYRNIVEAVDAGDPDGPSARVQYWRPADSELLPARTRGITGSTELVFFCPLVPDHDRAADIHALAATLSDAGSVSVLLAQGLMRSSGEWNGTPYREVHARDIGDDEAATWSCFDIVVFSDEDQSDAVAKARRWSAHPAARDTGFVVTQGEQGATLCYRGTATRVGTQPVAHESTPVGAGDVFGASVGLEFRTAHVTDGLEREEALHRAVAAATAAASRYVGRA